MEFWNGSQSRRRFVTFGLAGAVPFIAGRRALLAQRAAVGSARPSRDEVIEQITREIARTYTAMKKRGPRPEDVHSLGAQVRLMLAHGRAAGLDARVQAGMARAVDDRGRDAILDADVDARTVASSLAGFGMDVSDRMPRPHPARDRRAAMLDTLLVAGISPELERLNAAMERAEEKVDRLGAAPAFGPRGLLVQDCWTNWGALIDEMTAMAELASLFAPELAIWAWASAAACEVSMYVSCWGG